MKNCFQWKIINDKYTIFTCNLLLVDKKIVRYKWYATSKHEFTIHVHFTYIYIYIYNKHEWDWTLGKFLVSAEKNWYPYFTFSSQVMGHQGCLKTYFDKLGRIHMLIWKSTEQNRKYSCKLFTTFFFFADWTKLVQKLGGVGHIRHLLILQFIFCTWGASRGWARRIRLVTNINSTIVVFWFLHRSCGCCIGYRRLRSPSTGYR